MPLPCIAAVTAANTNVHHLRLTLYRQQQQWLIFKGGDTTGFGIAVFKDPAQMS